MTTDQSTVSIRDHVAGPAGTTRLFAAGSADFGSHQAAFGPLPAMDRARLIDELLQSGLDGRGGAGFAAWQKLASVPADGRRPVVVANGAEGEPLSQKDAALLHNAPHLVIDGILIAGRSLGAKELHLFAGAEQLAPVARALKERGEVRIRLHEAPDTFISGEATAVVSAISGSLAVPGDRTKRLTNSGLNGRPTLVHNVETLAHLALISRFGPAWFRSVGTGSSPGSRLITLSGNTAGPRVYEIPTGVRLTEILVSTGVDLHSVRAALVGGYHGTWLAVDQLDARFSKEGLAPVGARTGAGIIMTLGSGSCGLAATADILAYLAGQSARQCGPCINGLPAIASVFARLAYGDTNGKLPQEISRLAALVTGRGSCAHPDGTARLALSALAAFASDVDAHLRGRCEVLR
ncbi:NADH-ubiquinone oxidoreductase-F iron-sulfur binding region domain-containing protein [Arthrobacter sp. efr-133-TYG-118]|uniref:NADH-ubiquinone oxidoreductase-F iron-sulfur binding region domain-containing protein n=1 Tax=Arthrobacter sp. efr-133-TYG-118 TaxID=3040279 RepID=UPI00254CAF23|nr:NADH-ubiquinone oxidoreductase-F iron-sulfur binding region domain-containing protein [Arthrobacter sp. efr-133-TYG-118]